MTIPYQRTIPTSIPNYRCLTPMDFRTKGYYGYRVVINLDEERKVPIKIQIYDWDDQLVESYGYENLNLNAGLTDAYFDSKNPEYRF